MDNIAKLLENAGIVPVVKLDSAADALPLAKALRAGGINCAEITFRTDAALEAIKAIAAELPDMLIGAGTVLTAEKADEAMNAGAQFIVTPGFNPNVVKHCIENGYPIYPGCNTPADVEAALELGLTRLKFFPAELSGGLPMIKALCAPYTAVRFMPTGGINEKNITEYLSCDKVFACGGTWMVKDELIRAGKFDEIERRSAEAVRTMHGFALKHIGVNCENAEKAMQAAKMVCAMFGLPADEKEKSVFAGTIIEYMKYKGAGQNGHIAISVNSVSRAHAYFVSRGFEFNDSTAKYDAAGNLQFIYFKDEIAGFAFHLITK